MFKKENLYQLKPYFLFFFMGSYWLEIFYCVSYIGGTLAVVYKTRISIIVTSNLILAGLQTDWMGVGI